MVAANPSDLADTTLGCELKGESLMLPYQNSMELETYWIRSLEEVFPLLKFGEQLGRWKLIIQPEV